MHLHIYLHGDADGATSAKLDLILARLSSIRRQEYSIMSNVTAIKQLVSDLNEETNVVATKVDAQAEAIQALKDQIARGVPVTQADLDAIADGLTPISDRLKAIGADPAEPIPPA